MKWREDSGIGPGSSYQGLTVAEMDWRFEGIDQPGGCVIEITVMPTAAGSNALVSGPVPPANERGLVTIVPTEELPEEIDTLAVIPARKFWLATKFRVTGSRRAGRTVTFVFAAAAVVVILVGVEITNPDGLTVIVAITDW